MSIGQPRGTGSGYTGTSWREGTTIEELRFYLQALPPFRLDLTVWALRRRPENAVDDWDGQTYRRVLLIDGVPYEVAVVQPGPAEAPFLTATVRGPTLPSTTVSRLAATLEWTLNTRADLSGFYRLAAGDPQLAPLAQQFRGLKLPRYPTLFETLVNAIACQQVTLTLGIRLVSRLAQQYGVAMDDGGGHAFPRPEDLAGVSVEALRALGYSGQKARALTELVAAIVGGGLDLSGLVELDDGAIVTRLRQLRGVGRWTAEYVLLRGLGRWHVFPGDDVGARNHLQRWLGLDGPMDYQGVRRALDRWHPYAGLVYLHLLLRRLAELGYVH